MACSLLFTAYINPVPLSPLLTRQKNVNKKVWWIWWLDQQHSLFLRLIHFQLLFPRPDRFWWYRSKSYLDSWQPTLWGTVDISIGLQYFAFYWQLEVQKSLASRCSRLQGVKILVTQTVEASKFQINLVIILVNLHIRLIVLMQHRIGFEDTDQNLVWISDNWTLDFWQPTPWGTVDISSMLFFFCFLLAVAKSLVSGCTTLQGVKNIAQSESTSSQFSNELCIKKISEMKNCSKLFIDRPRH